MYLSGSDYLNATSFNGALSIIFKIVAEFILISGFIYYTNGDLSKPKYKRIKKVTEGLNIKKHWINKYYFPIFMIRRVIYVAIPLFQYKYQGF